MHTHTCGRTHTGAYGYHRNWKILKTETVSRCNKGVKAMMKQKPQYGSKIDTNTERSKDRKAKCPEWQNSTETIGSCRVFIVSRVRLHFSLELDDLSAEIRNVPE